MHPLDSGSPLEDGPFAVPFNADAGLTAPDGIEGLETLSKQGRWLEVAKRCTGATSADAATALTVVAYHVLALLKLSMHDQAAAELGKLGDLSGDAHADRAAAGDASLVPFALRVLSAEVPWQLGRRQEGVDRLHRLLEWCARQESKAAEAGSSSLAQLWQRRHRDVLLRAAAKHCQLRQFVPALSLLNRRLLASPLDAEAWVQAGLVQALLGDLAAAGGTLQRAEQLLAAEERDAGQRQQRQAAVHRNRGLLAFLHRDYRGAAKEFTAAQTADPGDAAAASNAALSQLYGGRLGDAVRGLERAFAAQPAAMLQEEGAVLNLATLYELGGSGASLAAKARMAAWVAAAAPDDFDLSCTKTQGA